MPTQARRLMVTGVAWTLVGIAWYIAIPFVSPGHPMPGTAVAVLTSSSAVASALDRARRSKWRQHRNRLHDVMALVGIVVVAAGLALSVICVAYYLFFREWPNWHTIQYNFALDVAWVGVHVIAASFAAKVARRMGLVARIR